MAVSAMDSLSYPPPTERIRCAGTIAITAAAKMPAFAELAASAAISPSNRVALTPNQHGTKQQTSFRLILSDATPVALSSRQIATDVICMPG